MTRKHFEMLADFFNKEIRNEIRYGRVDVALHNLDLAESLSCSLRQFNERFDKERFIERVLKDTHKNSNSHGITPLAVDSASTFIINIRNPSKLSIIPIKFSFSFLPGDGFHTIIFVFMVSGRCVGISRLCQLR